MQPAIEMFTKYQFFSEYLCQGRDDQIDRNFMHTSIFGEQKMSKQVVLIKNDTSINNSTDNFTKKVGKCTISETHDRKNDSTSAICM